MLEMPKSAIVTVTAIVIITLAIFKLIISEASGSNSFNSFNRQLFM